MTTNQWILILFLICLVIVGIFLAMAMSLGWRNSNRILDGPLGTGVLVIGVILILFLVAAFAGVGFLINS